MYASSPRPKGRLVHVVLALSATSLLVPLGLTGCGDDSSSPDPTPSVECGDPGTICTYAGIGSAQYSGDGGPPEEAGFYFPIDIEFVSNGDAYILDWNNHAVRKVENGILRTVMGVTTGFPGDGPDDQSDLSLPGAIGTTVHLNHPTQLIELEDGTILLSAWHNHKLRTYDPVSERVLVVCGAEANFAGDGGPSRDARLSQPQCTITDANGDWFILDQRNQRIRKISMDTGTIDTVVGTGTPGFGGDGGSPLSAMLHFDAGGNPAPSGALTFGPDGRLYISDTLNHRIRRVDFQADEIVTIAGTGVNGYNGDGIQATEAQLNFPKDLMFGPDGRLYVADDRNHRVRAIDVNTGIIETVAGTGVAGYNGDGILATEAQLRRPMGLEFDADGNLYIADWENNRIRKVTF
ncbi:MAG: hypothetical protein R3E97_13820 [Candidatus Eisenbacteria bacterium]